MIIKRFSYVLLCLTLFILGSCTHNDNTIGDRAAKKWEDFVMKDLVGQWNPELIEIKPLVGQPVFSTTYPVVANCSEDILELNRDLSGSFSHFSLDCDQDVIPFTWNHILLRLSFTLENNTTYTPILVSRSPSILELGVPVKSVMPYIKEFYPEIDQLEQDVLDLLFVNIIFNKKQQ